MPEAKPISPNSTGTANAGNGSSATPSASTAAMPKPTATTRSQRSALAARKPPSTMPLALHTM